MSPSRWLNLKHLATSSDAVLSRHDAQRNCHDMDIFVVPSILSQSIKLPTSMSSEGQKTVAATQVGES